MTTTLLHFNHSHYNEKVRWALDLKQVRHARRALLPGPHLPELRRLRSGRETPVLCLADAHPMAGSTAICLELDRRYPEPALLPPEPDARREVLDYVAELDETWGVLVRQVFLAYAFERPAWAAAMYTHGFPAWGRRAYRYGAFPLVRRLMRRHYALDRDSVAAARIELERGLRALEARVAETGFCVGDAFTLADLSAASLFGPTIGDRPNVPAIPADPPARLAAWLGENRASAAGAWITAIFAAHRPPDGAACVE